MSLFRTALRGGAALALYLPATAFGQVDIEYRDTTVEGDGLNYRVFFETEWHEYNNLDFRKIDESSDQALLDSDDRGSFAFTGIALELGYTVDEQTRFVVGVSHRGLWGADQMGVTNRYNGMLYFTSAYGEFRTKQENPWMFRVGRQFFDMGGIPGPEFVLLDIVDGVRIDVPLGNVGYMTVMPIDVPSLSNGTTDVNFAAFIGQNELPAYNFRGDTITRRHGARVVFDSLVKNLDLRAYGWYTDIGANTGSGADISYGGSLGNFSDNDWVANYGLRASYKAGPITPWVSVDGSYGIDRKELVATDVDTTGLSWYVGARLETGKEDTGRLDATVYYFDTLGPAFQDDGLQWSHGYVGMKAAQVGGLLANRYMGWHPTTYVGVQGIDDDPQDLSRKSGTRVLHADVGYSLPMGLSFGAGYWFLQDTGVTSLDMDDLDTLTPPFGYSREEFAAQERLGKVLGHEINVDVRYRPTKHTFTGVYGAVFLPGDFYEIEIGRIAGDQLGGGEMAWAASAELGVLF